MSPVTAGTVITAPSGAFITTSTAGMYVTASSTSNIFTNSIDNLGIAVRRLGKAVSKCISHFDDPGPIMRVSQQRITSGLYYHLFVMRGWARWGPEARVRWLVHLRQCCAQVVRDCDDHLLAQYRGHDNKEPF